MDESTSALDRESERLIQDALDEFSLNRTVVTIAHRLTTIQKSDCIFVLDRGTVAEFGSHNDLISKQGQYYNYVKKQQVDQKVQDKSVESIVHEDEIEDLISETQASPIKIRRSRRDIDQEPLSKKNIQVSDSIIMEKKDLTKNPKENFLIIDTLTMEKQGLIKNPEGNTLVNDTLTMKKPDLIKNLEGKEPKSKAPYRKMWADMKGEQLYFIIASFAAGYLGSLNPMIGYMLSESIETLSHVRDGVPGASDDLTVVFVLYIGFGVGGFICGYLSLLLFTLSGQSLAEKLRVRVFKKIMDNNIPFFDKPEHSPGNLCTKLEEDCSNLQNTMTGLVGVQIMNFGCLGFAIV